MKLSDFLGPSFASSIRSFKFSNFLLRKQHPLIIINSFDQNYSSKLQYLNCAPCIFSCICGINNNSSSSGYNRVCCRRRRRPHTGIVPFVDSCGLQCPSGSAHPHNPCITSSSAPLHPVAELVNMWYDLIKRPHLSPTQPV